MILQSLYDYYQRKTEEGDPDIAPFGFEQKEIPFVVELDLDGNLIQIEDTREQVGKKKRATTFLVPQGVKKAAGIATNFLWDNAEYVLGLDTRDKPERVIRQHQAFIDKIKKQDQNILNDDGVKAILAFLEKFDISSIENHSLYDEFKTNPNITFRLQGDKYLICQREIIISTLQAQTSDSENTATCLITGEQAEIGRLHTAIKGVWGAQTAGANIVSVNNKISNGSNAGKTPAFSSYGKQQAFNSPVSKQAMFAYTTAINHLLRKDSTQRIQVGDTSTVFWTEKQTELETLIPSFFSEAPKDEPDKGTNAVKSLYQSVHHGQLKPDEAETKFHILGLAPNAARIAIRFWETATVKAMSERLVQHFDDIKIDHSAKQLPHLPLFRLLVSTATLGKADNIPPNIAGETIRSILTGMPYPQTLLASAVRRNRAEQEVTYPRAAIIKACINRQIRYKNPEIKEELQVSLDKENTNTGYRLGRLFATLEKIQEEASPGLNATIRDRYYGAAASTPVTVFSTLLKLKNHHLSKMTNKGRVTNMERLMGEIMDEITDFPANLPLADQGRFSIGYYHQRQDFFKKRTPETDNEEISEAGATA